MRSLLRAFGIVVIVLATVTAEAGDGSRFFNDAGSGGDAPDSMSSAMPLGGWRSVSGYAQYNDSDWYAAPPAAGPACVEYTLSGVGRGEATLSVVSAQGTKTGTSSYNASTVKLGVAANGAIDARLGVFGQQHPSTAGDYALTASLLRISSVSGADAGSAGDAPNSGVGARIAPGCASGTADGVTDIDLYTIDAPAGTAVVVSFAASASSVSLEITAPGGQRVATLSPGELVTLPSLTSGTYTMSASSANLGSVAYLIGTIVGPPGSGCKPNC